MTRADVIPYFIYQRDMFVLHHTFLSERWPTLCPAECGPGIDLSFLSQVNDRPSQASTHGNLAVAYQALGAHDQALQHYLHHLSIARELRDTQSTARALGNGRTDGQSNTKPY
jgi:hypothetical protein